MACQNISHIKKKQNDVNDVKLELSKKLEIVEIVFLYNNIILCYREGLCIFLGNQKDYC